MKASKGLILSFFLFSAHVIYAQVNEWAWMKGDSLKDKTGEYGVKGVPSALNNPGGRYADAKWTDVSGNLWMFGGYGYSQQSLAHLNDVWKYSPSANEWTFMTGDTLFEGVGRYGTKGVFDGRNKPSGRSSCAFWTDDAGKLWLFGGWAFGGNGVGYGNDLWKYDPVINQWAWMGGDTTIGNHDGIYGTQGVPSANNKPGGRAYTAYWKDNAGNFWFFGGYGNANTIGDGHCSDLWKFNPSTMQWTWVNGDQTPNEQGFYGTKGVASALNKPGWRSYSLSWTDATGNLWMFGGVGSTQTTSGYLNDLWKYDIASNQWTWMKGDSTISPEPYYGVRGVEAPANTPGPGFGGVFWTDVQGNFWMQGGGSSSVTYDVFWKFNAQTNNWAWMRGDTLPSTTVYGTKGIPSPANTPGLRSTRGGWTDAFGNFWLFGGGGVAADGGGYLNDVWTYRLNSITPVHLLTFTAQLSEQSAVSGEQKVLLNWTAENEQSFDRYEVERSANGREFGRIGKVISQLSVVRKQYSYDDFLHSPLTAHNSLYYRLKMVDKDGAFTYSKTEKVSFNTQHTTFNIIPNPATTSVQLRFAKPLIGKVDIAVSDANGKVVMKKVVEGSDMIELSTSKLSAGIYVVKVVSEGEEDVQKMVVTK